MTSIILIIENKQFENLTSIIWVIKLKDSKITIEAKHANIIVILFAVMDKIIENSISQKTIN